MCLTLGLTPLSSTTEIQLVLAYQCTVGAPVWSARASMYIRITLVLLTDLYMHLIYPSLDSESISSLIFNFRNIVTPSRV